MKNILLIAFLITGNISLQAQGGRMTREEYIHKYKDLAIMEMKRTGFPASVKLAQGIVETGNGNSTLATKANNHFGIKCHNTWKGKRIYHDDDEKDECFRKYNSVKESYEDHSDFIKSASRYAFLFELDKEDYKAWARGLQKAGYATNKSYSDHLIRVIEESELFMFDRLSEDKKGSQKDQGEDVSGRMIYKRHRVNYILAEEGDTQESLRRELRLLPNQIQKYNELSKTDTLHQGQVIYIQPKRNKAEIGKHEHIVKEGETMHSISQLYAVKMSGLYKKNLMKPGTELVPGQVLSLRKQLKGEKPEKEKSVREKRVKEKRVNENFEETEKIQFEFN